MVVNTTIMKRTMAQQDINKLIIDSISAHVAVLDKYGVIIETNLAWRKFAEANGMQGPLDSIGMNYLGACDQAAGDGSDEAKDTADKIRRIIAGKQDEYFTKYPCHSPKEKRWFALRVVRIKGRGNAKVIVTHENITPIMEVQQKLEETNAALRVLLRQMNKEKQQIGEIVLTNVKELILPDINKLQAAQLQKRDRILVENIDTNLKEIISPFLNQLASVNRYLTPQEYRVASMVREGRTTKEIAEFLGISDHAVDFHRKKIRKKLGLTATGSNLRSYLLSLG
jgi:DNA-binding CsgD family transcriptional regulator